MEWKEYLKLYDQFPEEPVEQLPKEEKCECEHDYVFDKVMVCQKCGMVDDQPLYVEHLEAKKAKFYDYARKNYFIKRLRYMNRHVQCTLPEYDDIILKLKGENFETLSELKKRMKEQKLSKYYRYLYAIYYDIKGKKAIQMNYEQIENMAKLFMKIEREFRNKFPGKRNMVSYNMIFYYVFQFYGIDHQALILPKNKQKVGALIEDLLRKI